MTPIERVRAKDAARTVLGVRAAADATEIRAAWRRAAFAAHPDRHGGDQSGFVRAKAAYDLLSAGFEAETAQDVARPDAACRTPRSASHAARPGRPPSSGAAGGPAPQRPRIAEREMAVSEAARAACLEALAQGDDAPVAAHLRLHREAEPRWSDAPADHVPHALRRRGRAATFVLRGPLAGGRNRVALPACNLEPSGGAEPLILAITALRDGAGEVVLPEKVRARLFPGMREVRLRFEAR